MPKPCHDLKNIQTDIRNLMTKTIKMSLNPNLPLSPVPLRRAYSPDVAGLIMQESAT